MSMQIAVTGSNPSWTQGSENAQHIRMKTAEQKLTAPKNWTSPLSGAKDSKINIDVVAEELDRISFTLNTKLKFSIDRESHEILVKVIDPETDKVIKILPPEELRRLHYKIKEAVGIIFDELI
ncbi:MAG: flagellar protein FlaG [Treponema sp.]|nr:flagellar protein FlaG [Treponema sp.]